MCVCVCASVCAYTHIDRKSSLVDTEKACAPTRARMTIYVSQLRLGYSQLQLGPILAKSLRLGLSFSLSKIETRSLAPENKT